MTEELKLLRENNMMLRLILEHVLKEDKEDFITNVLANMVSERIMRK